MTAEARMRYPSSSPHETAAQRRRRVALSASVEREHAHAEAFGAPGPKSGEPPVVRQSPRGLSLPFELFRSADYGQVCALLGLSPSRPHATADGRDTRRRKRRRS